MAGSDTVTEALTLAVQDEAKDIKADVDDLVKHDVDSTDSDIRYMAYGARLRTALRAGQRYIAYTSDVGEAFRPVVPPWAVTAAYGISWVYLLGDVSYETYKAGRKGPTPIEAANFSEPLRLGLAATERATFQGIASMGLPAFTVHTTVAQAKKAFKNVQNPRVKAWGPTVTGLAVVPVLPYLFDHPVETVTEHAFNWIRQQWIGRNQGKAAEKSEL
ncbi:mitochondrial 18 KDa protein-domain-containing protein [Schizophyllum amplum]|uniref:Mitochondrial fission process protein 1 n=1 Tax=Schizophyllum amplum TaxID=97359 RepID=A0A550CUE6_9AGAR|nr:mitochondrial 18 KDa protein-domain-containing protein [Auriculariopsis ampla]